MSTPSKDHSPAQIPNINFEAIKVIYKYEMLRAWETLLQSFASPVISTALYFVVFGSAIGTASKPSKVYLMAPSSCQG